MNANECADLVFLKAAVECDVLTTADISYIFMILTKQVWENTCLILT